MYDVEAIARCAEIAARAHILYPKEKKNLTRKDGITPFIVHPARVASILMSLSMPYQVVCAAWLHDVIEDTTLSHDGLKEELQQNNISLADSTTIITLVNALTKDESKDRYGKLDSTVYKISSLYGLNRYYAVSIKLADCIDNLSILDGIDHSFIIYHYLPETEYLLSKLMEIPNGVNTRLEYMLNSIISKRKDEYGIRSKDA